MYFVVNCSLYSKVQQIRSHFFSKGKKSETLLDGFRHGSLVEITVQFEATIFSTHSLPLHPETRMASLGLSPLKMDRLITPGPLDSSHSFSLSGRGVVILHNFPPGSEILDQS